MVRGVAGVVACAGRLLKAAGVAGLCAVSVAAAAAADAAGAPTASPSAGAESAVGTSPGAIVAIGGALRADNTAVWQRVVQLAGGPGSRFVVLAMASGVPERAAAEAMTSLRAHGATAEAVLSADDPLAVPRLHQARGVFMTGGAQARLLQALLPNGEPAPLLHALRALQQRGGVVAGTSAGAAVLSEAVFIELSDVLSAMKRPLREGIEVGQGLGLLPPWLVVDQHFMRRGRIGRLLPLMLARAVPLGLGVGEDSAAVVQGDTVEVLGPRGVLFVDLRQARPASRRAEDGAFNVQDVRLSYLAHGDKLQLRTGAVTPSAPKRAGTVLDPNAPGHRGYFDGPPVSTDILGDFSLVETMARLVDSPHRQALGLAFNPWPAADDPAPELGFEWRLRIGPDSRSWLGATGERPTVVDLLLDVLPVRLARPLYQPWPQPQLGPEPQPPAR